MRAVDPNLLDLSKAARLNNLTAAATAALRSAADDRSHATAARMDAANHVAFAREVGHAPAAGDLERVKRLEVQETLAREREAAISREATPLQTLNQRVREFLGIRDIDMSLTAPVPARPRLQGRAKLEEVAPTRASIAAVKAERAQVAAAPWSRSDAVASITRDLDRLAASCDLQGSRFVTGAARGHLALIPDTGFGVSFAEIRQLEALLVVSNRPAIQAALERAADEAAQKRGGWGVSEAERVKRLNELDDRIFDLELAEERLLEDLESRGLTVQRRPDADVYAVLFLGNDEPVARRDEVETPPAVAGTKPVDTPSTGRRTGRSRYLASTRQS